MKWTRRAKCALFQQPVKGWFLFMVIPACMCAFVGDSRAGFLPRVDYPTDLGSWSVAIGDLNGDQVPDLAVANYGAGTVSLLLGDGAGGFYVTATLTPAGAPLAIAVGDFNGDGRTDIVTANYVQSATVSVWLGHGDGTFSERHDCATGASPAHVAINDLNADGIADLLISNFGEASVSVLLGNGDGTFRPAASWGVASNPLWSAIGDMNQDGRQDLVAACPDANKVSVLLGDGVGGFATRNDVDAPGVPRSVAIGDLNEDGKADFATADQATGDVRVFWGDGAGGRVSTTDLPTGDDCRSLVIADIDGDGHLDIVAPSYAGGRVYGSFGHGDGTFASSLVELTGVGPITVAVGDLDRNGATDVVTANASGSVSILLQEREVPSRIPSGVTLAVTPAAPMRGEPVTFLAAVTPDTASGTVTLYDGHAALGTSTVLQGIAKFETHLLSVGSHSCKAVYGGDASTLPSTSLWLEVLVAVGTPVIVDVRDVPRDQGGCVFLTWRFYLDRPDFQTVTGYRVWRRVPPSTCLAEGEESRSSMLLVSQTPRMICTLPGVLLDGRTDETFWEAIATLPAAQLVSYGYTAATTQDSMAGSNPYTAFFVQALTADPFTFYNSAPDSGYSVDNLAPARPTPFAAVYGHMQVALHWAANQERDLYGYRLYRGTSQDFVPSPSNLVVAQPDTGYVDQTGSCAHYYKLAAVDVHGNQSLFALVTPTGATSTLASLVSAQADPDRVRLVWWSGANPGLGVTVYRRQADTDWAPVASIWADGAGRLTYDDAAVIAGQRYGYRLGIRDGEAEAFAGETWVDVPLLALALHGVRPNPAIGSDLTVWFTLPSAESARLELLDVSGRRVAWREVGALGAGGHSVELTEGRKLAPGVYLVRLTQSGKALVARAAVIR